MATKKQPPKQPASHQRQTAANKARDKKSKELKFGITRSYAKKSNESEFEYMKRGFMNVGGGPKDIKKAIGGATKAVKKVVKKLNG